ncbi:MAG: alpha/beta hydrolase [Chryseolinea sp.]
MAIPKMRKRWKLLIFALILIVSSASGLAYYLFANAAPIVSGQVIRNITYKEGLNLDIYLPTKTAYDKTPVVLYLHGGAWIYGIKEGLNFNRFNEAANELRGSGYAIISINYTLATATQSPFPACIEDATDALKWIEAHAPEYNFDLNNVGLFGESAGAHIAMMVAYSPRSATSSTIPLRYVVETYGPAQMKDVYRAPLIDTLNVKLAHVPDRVRGHLDVPRFIFGFDPRQDSVRAMQMMETYSPYNFITHFAPPTLIIHGDKDRVVPVDQSVRLHAKLDSLQVENEIHVVAGADHAFAYATPEQKAAIQKWIVEFILMHHSASE